MNYHVGAVRPALQKLTNKNLTQKSRSFKATGYTWEERELMC